MAQINWNDWTTFEAAENYTVDEFEELQDLQYSELNDLKEFREMAMKDQEGTLPPEDRVRFEELELQFKNKIITSATFNKFQSALVGVQTYIKNEVFNTVVNFQNYVDGEAAALTSFVNAKEASVTSYVNDFQTHVDNVRSGYDLHVDQTEIDITNYVNTKQGEMDAYVITKTDEVQAEIDKFQYRGDYNPVTLYNERNVVSYDDGSGSREYLCILQTTGNFPTNSTYWRQLTIKGEKGENGIGIGLDFKGAWDNSTVYAAQDGVQYGGVLFASLIDANIGNEPNLSADTAYWARALNVTVSVERISQYRNIATETSTVGFIIGDIEAYNPSIDSLEVYVNSTRLTEGADYTVSAGSGTITKTSGTWDGSSVPVFFEFVLTRNMVNNLIFSDGQSIANETISAAKLMGESITPPKIAPGAVTREKINLQAVDYNRIEKGLIPLITDVEPAEPATNQIWIDLSVT